MLGGQPGPPRRGCVLEEVMWESPSTYILARTENADRDFEQVTFWSPGKPVFWFGELFRNARCCITQEILHLRPLHCAFTRGK